VSRTALATTLLLATLAPLLQAQNTPSVQWGDRVRVRVACNTTASGRPCRIAYTEGLMLSLTGDTLVLQDGGQDQAFRLQDLERLERWVAADYKPNRIGRGMLLGLGLGLFSGMIVGGAVNPPKCLDGARSGFFCGEDMRGLDALAGAVVGGGGGLFIGGIVGGILSAGGGGSHWQRVPLSDSRQSSAVEPAHPFHVGISVAF
jgi:hypothetical protein